MASTGTRGEERLTLDGRMLFRAGRVFDDDVRDRTVSSDQIRTLAVDMKEVYEENEREPRSLVTES